MTWQRRWQQKLVTQDAYVPKHRAELVAAALTVLRAFVVAGKPGQYVVEVRNGGLVTEHCVTLDNNNQSRLARGVDPEYIITATFRFLLDREPAGAILTEFDITTISSFFPKFEAELATEVRKRRVCVMRTSDGSIGEVFES